MSEERGGIESGERVSVFVGVRHHSPVGVRSIWESPREWQPVRVLIEVPVDFESLTDQLTDPELKPPFAIMAYTTEVPVRGVLYPFTVYSSEYRALLAARGLGIPVAFYDLPSSYMLGLQGVVEHHLGRKRDEIAEKKTESATEPDDMKGFWERYLEQSPTLEDYPERSWAFGEEVRATMSDECFEQACNAVRKTYTRRVITEEIATGIPADCLVVLVDAFHTPALLVGELFDDAVPQKLPQCEAEFTLIPYPHQRLSSRSGYVAGNLAPVYYEPLWEALMAGKSESHAVRYLFASAVHIRERGGLVSSAEMLEATSLAKNLTRLCEGIYLTHEELKDTTMTCLGHGSLGEIAEGIVLTDIGTKIGHVPIGGLLTSIQRDFTDQCADLKLNFSPVAEKLRLDLRENRRTKNERSVFLQSRRSFLLQRLRLLGIGFAALQGSRQQDASWEENQVLSRTPEAEMQLAEVVLKGDTIAYVVSFDLQEELTVTERIAEITELLENALLCGMPELLQATVSRPDSASIDEISIEEIVRTAKILSRMLQSRDVWQSDVSVLRPILERLSFHTGLTLMDVCFCGDEAAGHLAKSIEEIQRIFSVEKGLPSEKWEYAARELSCRDDLNAKFSGFAMAIRLDLGDLGEEELSQEISRRMSVGLRAELGVFWFEGLSLRNHYTLIVRRVVWESLSRYIDAIPEDCQQRVVVLLRRAFMTYTAGEKDMVAGNLAGFWGLQKEQVSEALNAELSREESQTLESSDFDDF